MALDLKEDNETVQATLEEGDLVEFPRELFSHWGIYVGKGDIVHFGGVDISSTAVDSSCCSAFTKCGTGRCKASVKKEKFMEVAGQSKAKKNNDKDKTTPPLPIALIRENVSSTLRSSYNPLWNNCEHFATWCRYGIAMSQQVDAALTSCLVMGAKVATTGIVLGTAKVATKGIVLGGLSVLASIDDRKSEPTSCNATNFGNVIAGGRNEIPVLPQVNGATSWFSVGLTVLFGVGKLCYDAYTGGNDRRESSTSYSSRMDYFADGRDSNLNTFIRESSTSYSPRMDYFADGRGSNLNTFIRALSASQSPGWNNFGDWTGIGIQPTGRFCFNQGRRTGAFTWKC